MLLRTDWIDTGVIWAYTADWLHSPSTTSTSTSTRGCLSIEGQLKLKNTLYQSRSMASEQVCEYYVFRQQITGMANTSERLFDSGMRCIW